MKVFVDTSAFFALLDSSDINHRRALQLFQGLLDSDAFLVTTNYILVESLALVQNRLGVEAVRALLDDMLPVVTVHWVTPETHALALSAMLAARRRRLSLVDCVSFEIMRTSGCQKAFTFDSHFREQGYAPVS